MARAVVRFAKAGSVRRVKLGRARVLLVAAVVPVAMAAASVAVAAMAAAAAAVVRRAASARPTERPVEASQSSGSPHSRGGSAGPTSHGRWQHEAWSPNVSLDGNITRILPSVRLISLARQLTTAIETPSFVRRR